MKRLAFNCLPLRWFNAHRLRIFLGIEVIFLELCESAIGIKSKTVQSAALTNESALITDTTVLYTGLYSEMHQQD